MACNLLVAFGNFLFQGLIGRKLSLAEYGYTNAAASAVLFLSVPVVATSNALVHYIARFVAAEQKTQLASLVASARRWLAFIAGTGFVLALCLINPLTTYCGFPRGTLVVLIAANMAAMLGTVFVTALCTGMGWYARLGCIAFAAIATKLVLAFFATGRWPMAESAIAAAAISSLVYGCVFLWRSEFVKADETLNPCSGEFLRFAGAALISAVASYAFTQSDVLMAQRNLSPVAVAQFCAAGVFSRAFLGLTAPLLTVFFATRSAASKRQGYVATYAALLGSYLAVMVAGGVVIVVMRSVLIHLLFGRPEAVAASLVTRFAFLMVAIGMIEILANWALAARLWKIVWLHGSLAVCYVTWGLFAGRTAEQLLGALTTIAGVSIVALLGFLLAATFRERTLRRADPVAGSLLIAGP